MYVIYNDLLDKGKWFYGMFDLKNAQQVAYRLNKIDNTSSYCICTVHETTNLNIQNVPNYVIEEIRGRGRII